LAADSVLKAPGQTGIRSLVTGTDFRLLGWSPPAISLGYHQSSWPEYWQQLTWQGTLGVSPSSTGDGQCCTKEI